MREVEREFSLAAAETRARRFLRIRGWQAELHPVAAADGIGAWRCQLTDGDGTALPEGTGAGKGPRDAARVGALFESIEHHLSQDLGSYQPHPHRAGAVAAVFAQDALGPLLAEQPGAWLPCLPYTEITGGHDHITWAPLAQAVPAYLEHPRTGYDDFDYTGGFTAHCTNSGFAIGCSPAEAGLHALNEVIERDALSLLLCRAFLGDGTWRPRVLDPATLPAALALLLAQVQDRLDARVRLLEITTDIGVPTVLAYLPPGARRDRHGRGLGTSLDRGHALRRALCELLQTELLGDVTAPAALGYLDELDPVLGACARFDLTDHLDRATRQPYRASPSPPRSVPAQLALVDAAVRAHGLVPRWHLLPVVPELVCVVHVSVPGTERIMTLLQGHPALPGPRGLHAADPNGAPA